MSELNLATSGQFEVNAKHPSAVDYVDSTILNMKVGAEFDPNLKEHHYGYAAKGSALNDMGRVSENAEAVLSLVLDHFQIQGERDYINMAFAGNAQIPGVTHAVITLGPDVDVEVVWNGGTGIYESLETPGIGDIARRMVGGTYPMTITNTSP